MGLAGVVGTLGCEIVYPGNTLFVMAVFFKLVGRESYGKFAVGIGGYGVNRNTCAGVAQPKEPVSGNKTDANGCVSHGHSGIGDCFACNHHIFAKVVTAFGVGKRNLESGCFIFAHRYSLCAKSDVVIFESDAESAVHAVGRHLKFAADAPCIVGDEGVGGNGFAVAVVERNSDFGILEQLRLFCGALKYYCRVFHCFARAIYGKVGERG